MQSRSFVPSARSTLGLGGLVNRGSGGVGGVPYIDFLAPGLIAATTMQTAAFESMYPILAKIMWDRTYFAMLATPLAVRDVLVGEVTWLTLRLTMVASLFWFAIRKLLRMIVPGVTCPNVISRRFRTPLSPIIASLGTVANPSRRCLRVRKHLA